MNKIQIFIVTGNGVEKEFLEISDFINGINKHLERAYKISVDLMTIEDLEAPVWKQEEYKEKICNSEMVFFLIFTEMNNFIMEDFEAAFKKLKSDGKPDIYTYFYKGNETERDKSVQNFMDKLSNEIGHYWSIYDHIDTIKLKILMCLKLSKLDMVEMCFRDGKLVIDERDVMSLENVKMFSENDSMKILMKKKMEVEKEYIAAKSLYLQNNKDDEIRKKYIKMYTEKENILKSIEETEKQLFNQSLSMIKTARGELTERQVKAYRLFEEGKAEIANKILDSEEMEKDFETKMQKREQEDKRLASIYIGELKTKIEILETMTEYAGRFKEIEDSYEKITKTALKYNVEYDAICDYVWFLYEQGKDKKALEIGKAVEEIYNKNESISKYEKSDLLNVLGVITDDILGMQDESEEYYIKAMEIMEELVKGNAERYNLNLATSYCNLGIFYTKQGKKVEEAKKYHLKAIKIREELVKENAERYNPYLANSYNNTGNFYSNQGEAKKAEEYYIKAMKIYKELAKENAERYNPDLALSYNNLGIFYYDLREVKKEEEYYLKAMEIREELVKENAERYNPDLADSYDGIGIFYSNQGETKKAKEYLLKAMEIREELVKKNAERYNHALALSYNNVGIFYYNQREVKEAEEYFLKAIDIIEEIVKKNAERYNPYLAKSYNNIGSFYADRGKVKEAEEYFLKAIDIQERLVEKCGKGHEASLAKSYSNYGLLKENIEYDIKAFELAKKNMHNPHCRKIVEQLMGY